MLKPGDVNPENRMQVLQTFYPTINIATFVKNMKILEANVINLNIKEFEEVNTKIHQTISGNTEVVKAPLISEELPTPSLLELWPV